MRYSPIASIRVIDFMATQDTTISFMETSRIVLEGYNSSGKSSLATGVDIAGTNSFTTEQKDYIKDEPYEAESFKIIIKLMDGHLITYVRLRKGYYWTVEKDKQILLDTRLSNGKYTIVEANKVPLLVQQLLGFVTEPTTNQKLNFRRGKDGMLFVGVPGSTNYKMVYRQLDLPEVVEAIKEMNEDRLKMDKEISHLQSMKVVKQDEYLKVRVYNQEILDELHNEIQSIVTKVKGLNHLKDLHDGIIDLNKIIEPYIEPIDFGLYKNLEVMKNIADRLNTLSDLVDKTPFVENVESTMLKELVGLNKTAQQISDIKTSLNKSEYMGIVDSSRLIEIYTLKQMSNAINALQDKLDKTTEIKAISTDKFMALLAIKNISTKINELKSQQTVEVNLINSDKLLSLFKLKAIATQLKTTRDNFDKLGEIPFNTEDINNISLNIKMLNELKALADKVKSARSVLQEMDKEAKSLHKELHSLQQQIKDNGMTICPKCNNVFSVV